MATLKIDSKCPKIGCPVTYHAQLRTVKLLVPLLSDVTENEPIRLGVSRSSGRVSCGPDNRPEPESPHDRSPESSAIPGLRPFHLQRLGPRCGLKAKRKWEPVVGCKNYPSVTEVLLTPDFRAMAGGHRGKLILFEPAPIG